MESIAREIIKTLSDRVGIMVLSQNTLGGGASIESYHGRDAPFAVRPHTTMHQPFKHLPLL